ncbi:MAG TPA: GTP cyclohydrolase I FolE [Longimicrobiaceae bacterium]|nr:GTP cyclohydrolase I FolE [Longimicrobiaceae bacterium]
MAGELEREVEHGKLSIGAVMSAPEAVAGIDLSLFERVEKRNGKASPDGDPEAELAALVGRMLELLGERPEREGLLETPRRVAKSLRWLTSGNARSASDAIGSGIFEEHHDSMVLVKDIEIYSLCEHHMLPFFGRAHVAYLPEGRIVGLSKLARLVDVFARRLQVQERLTDQIADALCEELRPRGVAVLIEARHLCMMMRGVEKQNSETVTSAMRGEFADCAMTRSEFLSLALRG